MKRFAIVGADKDSGSDVSVTLHAKDQATAEAEAQERGILVASITAMTEPEADTIELIDEPAPAAGATGEQAHGAITLSANSPSDRARTAEGHTPGAPHAEAAMEYHLVMNQALYLLEVAVNKYIVDGWEPQGGLSIGTSNNSLLYFQALVRKKKAGGPKAAAQNPPADAPAGG